MDSTQPDTVKLVTAVLDSLHLHHAHAKEANIDKYFECFSPHAQFLGTASDESWSMAEYREYMTPIYKLSNIAAQFLPKEGCRKFGYYPSIEYPEYVTFDEILECQGQNIQVRGTGALAFDPDSRKWLIVLYHLNVPIPNDVANEVCHVIKRHSTERGGLPSKEEST